jgi:hypothetical protein
MNFNEYKSYGFTNNSTLSTKKQKSSSNFCMTDNDDLTYSVFYFQNDLKNNLQNDLKNNLKNNLKNDLKNNLKNDLKNDLQNDLKNNLKNDLKNDLQNDLKNDLQNDLQNDYSESISSINHIPISRSNTEKEKYNKSKIYQKYLMSVQTKLENSDIKINAEYINNFNNNYSNAMFYFEEIKKEWFWLSNSKICIFRSNFNSIEQSKINIAKNYDMLKCVAKLYGFDAWYFNFKLKKKQISPSVNDISNRRQSIQSDQSVQSVQSV